MKVLLKHITELDFLLFSAKSYYLSSSAMSNLYQIVSWNLLKFISTASEYSNISLVLFVFKLTSWFNSISFEAEINSSLQKPSTALGENEYRWSLGVFGVLAATKLLQALSLWCSRDPVSSKPMEWGAVLRIQKAVINVMEFPAEKEAFLEVWAWEPTPVSWRNPDCLKGELICQDASPLPANSWLPKGVSSCIEGRQKI